MADLPIGELLELIRSMMSPWVEFKVSEEEEYGNLDAFELSRPTCDVLNFMNGCADRLGIGVG